MYEPRRLAARFSLAWICCFAYLISIYYPVALISYAHHDQYRYFVLSGPDREEMRTHRTSDSQWRWLRWIGRPVAAELEYQIFRHVNVVDDLKPVRVIGVGLYAAAMAIYLCFLLELGLSVGLAFCLSGALFSLPAVQFSVYMASFNHPVAHILALCSGLLMRQGSRLSADDPRWYFNRARIIKHMWAIALLVVALLSYAPSAFVVLFMIAAEIGLKGIAGWPATRRHLIRDVFLISVAGLIYFAIIKQNYLAYGGHRFRLYKVEMNGNLADRFSTFQRDLLASTLNLWNVQVRPLIAFVVGGFLLSGLGLLFFRQFWSAVRNKARPLHSTWNCLVGQVALQYTSRTQRASRCLQLVGAIALVLILSETTYFTAPLPVTFHRAHFAVGGLIVIFLAGAAAAWGRLLPARWRRQSALVLGPVVLLVAGVCAHGNVLKNCLNDHDELSYISAQIAAHAGEPLNRIHIIQPSHTDYSFNGERKVPTGEEFNVPTSDCDTSVVSLLCAALLNVFDPDSYTISTPVHTPEGIAAARPRAIILTSSHHGDPVVPSPNMLVIDMDNLLNVVAPTKRPMLAVPATASRAPAAAPQRTY